MKKFKIILLFIAFITNSYGQGFNHQWLLGYDNWTSKGRLYFDSTSYMFQVEQRIIGFNDTQGNISDSNGNLLMSSNGVWISNANNDTMLNGAGLNPGYFVNSWPDGLLITYGNFFLPFPGDSSKYILFHQTENSPDYPSNILYYSIVDITLDSGLGAVTVKNDTAFQDTLSWGISACRHANGRDWWVFALKDSSDIIFKILLTPNGIESVTSQHLNYTTFYYGNSPQITMSPQGDRLAISNYKGNNINSYLIISDFDRCSGTFSNTRKKKLIVGDYIWGIAFSPSGQLVYAGVNEYIFQVNPNTLSVDTVATYDGFISGWPPNCCATTFFNLYLAANGKIYGTSGSSTQHLHEINYPDSAGMVCDVQQHAISLGIWNFRSVPNHPNYYLGCLQGSPCDTLQWTGIEENQHDFRFRIYPNPISNNALHIGYLLPQNKSGLFQIYDITGKIVFKYNLPQWSNEQSFTLPKLSNGIYQCIIKSENSIATKKLVVIKE